ncbi:hypothetical protein IF1G_03885 [Cordyceps javanica]|uniref:Uncharacterized protein n=1 Tax=Cordyceps javanica TaxID=43265 RepID=A0A545V8U7_9HYPO|nr:hypothetical protein IF1G_03885 [Cordyceps javanica]
MEDDAKSAWQRRRRKRIGGVGDVAYDAREGGGIKKSDEPAGSMAEALFLVRWWRRPHEQKCQKAASDDGVRVARALRGPSCPFTRKRASNRTELRPGQGGNRLFFTGARRRGYQSVHASPSEANPCWHMYGNKSLARAAAYTSRLVCVVVVLGGGKCFLNQW